MKICILARERGEAIQKKIPSKFEHQILETLIYLKTEVLIKEKGTELSFLKYPLNYS